VPFQPTLFLILDLDPRYLYYREFKTSNNNNQICVAEVCGMSSEVLDGQLQSCYTARAMKV